MVKQRCSPLGDSAIRIEFGNKISVQVNRDIRGFCELIRKNPPRGITEWVPSYTAVTVYYQPVKITYHELFLQLQLLLTKLNEVVLQKSKQIFVPVCYEGELAPDIEYVALYNKLTVEEVVKIHSSSSYLIYMLGFTPGFPYMGGMSKAISTPRLFVPRRLVPAGSVGIAENQTGIYSLNTPGGWQIIGRTPLILYKPNRKQPSLFEAGDYVKFQPVQMKEYEKITELVQHNEYELQYEFI